MQVGDLVRMKDTMYDSKLIGIVLGSNQGDKEHGGVQIAITCFGGSGSVEWEPAAWLEVVSESR